jgi:hypothetical protein
MTYEKPEIADLGDAGQLIQGSKSEQWEIPHVELIAPLFEHED